MLSLEREWKAYEGLIKYAAHRYSADGHAFLNVDDLEAEGWLVFAKTWKVAIEKGFDRVSFGKWFKVSLFNQMNLMLETYRYREKRGYSKDGRHNHDEFLIDLSDVAEELGVDCITEFYYQEYVNQVREIISAYPDAVRIFDSLIEPDERICQMAVNEAKRKRCLLDQGILVRGADVVRVKPKHIRKYLGLSEDYFSSLLKYVRGVVLSVVNTNGPVFEKGISY